MSVKEQSEATVWGILQKMLPLDMAVSLLKDMKTIHINSYHWRGRTFFEESSAHIGETTTQESFLNAFHQDGVIIHGNKRIARQDSSNVGTAQLGRILGICRGQNNSNIFPVAACEVNSWPVPLIFDRGNALYRRDMILIELLKNPTKPNADNLLKAQSLVGSLDAAPQNYDQIHALKHHRVQFPKNDGKQERIWRRACVL